MKQPTISVIVPVYNVEKHLNTCVESVLSQKFDNWELLLINDGSSDSSGTICDEYANNDSRIKVFHKKNGGVSSARNIGLDNAVGEIVFFIDSDDFLDMTCFENIVSYDDCDLIICAFKSINSNGYIEEINIGNHEYHDADILDCILLLDNMPIPAIRSPWGKFYKRAIIENYKLRFKEGVNCGEDFIFNLDYIYNINSIKTINSFSYFYILSDNGLSSKLYFATDFIRWQTIILNRFMKLALKYNAMDVIRSYKNDFILRYTNFAVIRSLSSKDFVSCIECLRNIENFTQIIFYSKFSFVLLPVYVSWPLTRIFRLLRNFIKQVAPNAKCGK